ncbi:hypothetical protein BC332_28223 [Capsicum chinense]|nr:hypothetical protein BC332_28223 [Capsicum chinense]
MHDLKKSPLHWNAKKKFADPMIHSNSGSNPFDYDDESDKKQIGKKLLGSLGGILSKTWNPKTNHEIIGPIITRGSEVKFLSESFLMALNYSLEYALLLQCIYGCMFLTGKFYYLEQLILKHNAAAQAIIIKQMDQGIDMFFSRRRHAEKFVEFIGKVVPSRSRNDKQLVSHDPKSNNYNYKYTFSVEISPVCREDLICLPPKASNSLGNLGPLVICTKVSNHFSLLDPFTLRNCFLDVKQYCFSRQLVEYIVLDIKVVPSEVNIGRSK